jgi:hypothetical protein
VLNLLASSNHDLADAIRDHAAVLHKATKAKR